MSTRTKKPKALCQAVASFEAQAATPRDYVYEIEATAFEASKVSGALRAVACMSRGWHSSDHEELDMTKRSDVADLMEVLSGTLDHHLGEIERLAGLVR